MINLVDNVHHWYYGLKIPFTLKGTRAFEKTADTWPRTENVQEEPGTSVIPFSKEAETTGLMK